MIKFLNDGELNNLKYNFWQILSTKKFIEDKTLSDFIEGKLSLKNAMKAYKNIVCYKYASELYPTANNVMVEYMIKNNIWSEVKVKEICKNFNDHYHTDDGERDRDDCCGEIECYIEILKDLCKTKGIEVYTETFYDIAHGYIYDDVGIFAPLRRSLLDHMGVIESDAEEDYPDFYDIFQDEATAIVLEGITLNKSQLLFIDKQFNSCDNSVRSEIFIDENDNTNIIISGSQVWDGLTLSLLLATQIVLMNI